MWQISNVIVYNKIQSCLLVCSCALFLYNLVYFSLICLLFPTCNRSNFITHHTQPVSVIVSAVYIYSCQVIIILVIVKLDFYLFLFLWQCIPENDLLKAYKIFGKYMPAILVLSVAVWKLLELTHTTCFPFYSLISPRHHNVFQTPTELW